MALALIKLDGRLVAVADCSSCPGIHVLRTRSPHSIRLPEMARRWEFYYTAAGGRPVQKEIDKCRLSINEQAKVQMLMDRVAEGRAQPGDVKELRSGVLEVRVRVGKRQLRLLYAELGDRAVLLALHFFQKQRQVEARHINLAVDRLRDWRARAGS